MGVNAENETPPTNSKRTTLSSLAALVALTASSVGVSNHYNAASWVALALVVILIVGIFVVGALIGIAARSGDSRITDRG